MKYIPKNRIVSNLYTNGGDFQILTTGENYTGYYWKSYDGSFFTGKNQNDIPSQKLIKSTPSELPFSNPKKSYSSLNTDNEYSLDVEDYIAITSQNPNQLTQFLPHTHFPKPTKEDYKLEEFTRYFCVKINTNTFMEISKETFNSIFSQDVEWDWEPYIPFKLKWNIKGDKEEVKTNNYKLVVLKEKELKRMGLKEYLNNNYLTFWYP